MKFSIFQDSRIGGRPNNEDRIGYRHTAEALLMVVADGMGGHGHGEVAAEAAVRSVVAAFDRAARPRLADVAAFLADALNGAHAAIRAQGGLRQLAGSPRTTCTVCVVQDGVAAWAHAGDSRLYVLRRGQVLARTRDHSRAQAMIDAGLLAEADARGHSARNLITACLGGEQPPRVELSRRTPLMRGDVVVLCSDGVWSALPDDTAFAALSTGDALRAAPGLLDRAESRAGPGGDNLSLIALAWADDYPVDAAGPPAIDPGAALPGACGNPCSDDEINRAIQSIRARPGIKEHP